MNDIGIYVHIPFCKSKCKYCDFISFQNCNESIKEYIEALSKSIKNFSNIDNNINTIYFGGGTPSIIDSIYIKKILEDIKEKFNVNDDCEITLEINPGTVYEEKLKRYFNMGINRLSIGLQSCNDELLKSIGRIHNYEQFLQAYNLARKVGFKNINVDLMLALPNQKMEDLEDSLNKVISLNPEHISLYSLILEEGTLLYKEVNEGKKNLPSDDEERMMYHKTKEILEKNSYIHYEISNFAKKGYYSKHNMNCWNQEEYLGFGLASHSYFDNKRYCNISNLNEYILNIKNNEFDKNIIINEVQDEESKMKEFMMIGFRKLEGNSITKFKEKFNVDPLEIYKNEIKKLEEENLIKIENDFVKLTDKGLDLANLVFEEFV